MTRNVIEKRLLELGIVKYKVIERVGDLRFRFDRTVDIRLYWDISDSFRPCGVIYRLERLRWYECLFNKKQWIRK